VPASNTSTLSLAGRLRDLDDDDLVALLTLREVRDVRVRDFFDLADALLDPVSIQKSLAALDRATLAAIATLDPSPAGADLDRAFALALVDRTTGWVSYDPVADQLRSWPSIGLPSVDELKNEPAPVSLMPVSDADARFIDHAAGEHAFNATNAVAALLAELQREPARELARGGIALPETKRLATAMTLELDDVAPIV